MKLEIENSANTIYNAYFEITKNSMSVFINTNKRWIEPDSFGSGPYGFPTNDYLIPYEYTFEFYNEEKDVYDVVRLIAENDEEYKILLRPHFVLHEKDQLWYLFPKKSVYK